MIERLESRRLGSALPYSVYLPPNYRTAGTYFPLLLLLHGNGGDETSWDPGLEVLDQLIEAGEVPPLVAIAPGTGTSWWVDGAEPIETVVIEELLPHVEARYRTLPHRAGRALAGFSMGGYGALRYALSRPETFSATSLLSPSLYDQLPPPGSSARSAGAFGTPFEEARWQRLNYPAMLERYRRQDARVPAFIAVGDADWNEPAGWTYNVEYQAVLLFERLHKEAGSPAQLRVAGGGHDWSLWRPMFAEALRYTARFLAPPSL